NITPPAAPAIAPMEAPGRLLARSREARNLSVADVARQLKLSAWQIEALEAGHYQRLPGTVFVRGFIRNYARLLRLDPEALLQSAGDLPQSAPRPETPPSRDIPFPTAGNRRWRTYTAVVAVAVVAVLVVYEFYWDEPETAWVRRPVAAVPVLPVPQPLLAPAEAADAGTPAAADDALPGRPVAATAAAASEQAKDAPSSAAVALRDYDQQPEPGERQVRMKFEQESWVESRDRNEKVIFSQLNRPGTEQSVNGRPPLALVVGNAHGVRMIYDDQPVDLARHTKIDVARFILP
ncbi:MAG: helix-turn-helix domain-containing protein, partial [Betaproteobacteria bacterium]|nr:helix-turn-helix domain-containing protein [Betaproteobacteria bacterium]